MRRGAAEGKGAKAPSKAAPQKGRKRVAGQGGMLLPISGKKATATEKPAARLKFLAFQRRPLGNPPRSAIVTDTLRICRGGTSHALPTRVKGFAARKFVSVWLNRLLQQFSYGSVRVETDRHRKIQQLNNVNPALTTFDGDCAPNRKIGRTSRTFMTAGVRSSA
jgi:hypothetical protein